MTDVMLREEEVRRDQLEAVVAAGLKTFIEVGQALLELRDGRLYRATHNTFDAYLRDRFGFTRQHAYRLMGAAETAAAVSPVGDIRNERQARALAGLQPDEQRATYRRAQEQTGVAQPSATALTTARVATDVVEPAPGTRRRRALPEQMRDAAYDLHKLTNRFEKLVGDDRFTQHRETLTRHEPEIHRAVAVLQTALDALRAEVSR